MYKTTHHSNALQMDFWPAALGGIASDVSLMSPHWLLWGFSNFGTATEVAGDFQAHFARETESNEFQLLQKLSLNPAIEFVGVSAPTPVLVVDYF